MKASDFPALLRDLEIPGASVKPADGSPGTGLNHGFVVTAQHGARMAFQVAFHEDGKAAGDGPLAVFPEAIEIQPDRMQCAHVEANIAAWIGASPAAPYVRSIFRYSDKEDRALHFGLTIDLYSGGRVFIQALWILEPGEIPDDENKYRMHNAA